MAISYVSPKEKQLVPSVHLPANETAAAALIPKQVATPPLPFFSTSLPQMAMEVVPRDRANVPYGDHFNTCVACSCPPPQLTHLLSTCLDFPPFSGCLCQIFFRVTQPPSLHILPLPFLLPEAPQNVLSFLGPLQSLMGLERTEASGSE